MQVLFNPAGDVGRGLSKRRGVREEVLTGDKPVGLKRGALAEKVRRWDCEDRLRTHKPRLGCVLSIREHSEQEDTLTFIKATLENRAL